MSDGDDWIIASKPKAAEQAQRDPWHRMGAFLFKTRSKKLVKKMASYLVKSFALVRVRVLTPCDHPAIEQARRLLDKPSGNRRIDIPHGAAKGGL